MVWVVGSGGKGDFWDGELTSTDKTTVLVGCKGASAAPRRRVKRDDGKGEQDEEWTEGGAFGR